MPAATFSGKLEIHLMPSTRLSPPMDAGERDDARGGPVGEAQEVRRRIDGLARAVGAVGGLDQGDDIPVPPLEGTVHLAAGDHRERRRGVGNGHHGSTKKGLGQDVAGEPDRIAEDHRRRRARPRTGRGYGPARRLSTSSRSPLCHGSPTDAAR